MEAELMALAAAARQAAPKVKGKPTGLAVSTTKETKPPKRKKEKKKDHDMFEQKQKKERKKKQQQQQQQPSQNGGNKTSVPTTTGGRPRRPSFDASSSSYGRLDVKKPPAVVAPAKFAGKKIPQPMTHGHVPCQPHTVKLN